MTVQPFPHRLHLYEKPKAGNRFIDRFVAHNYKHRISAVGWFDTATCDIVPRSFAMPQRFVDQFLGNRVAIYVDNPSEAIWEGFINRLTFNQGGVSFTISLDEMMNRVTVKNTQHAATLVTTTAPDTVYSLASQSVYGVKEGVLDAGFFRVTGTTRAATLGDTKLQQLSWPQQSIDKSDAPAGLIHLEMLGFYHTLKWEERNVATTSTATLTNMIIGGSGVLPGLLNGATFLDNTDFTEIATNTVTMPIDEYRGRTPWDTLVQIQETGDTNKAYYVVGVTETDLITSKRRLYYRAANNVIEYQARIRDELRPRDIRGRVLPPWWVRPDRAIRISDWILGGAIQGDDPRETYILTVDYDANAQRVIWRGDDSKTAEAAFQLHRNTKPFGKRFGAPPYPAAVT